MLTRFEKFKLWAKPVTDYAEPVTKHITKENALQATNAVLAILVIRDMLKNPDASCTEFLFDAAVHLLQAAVTAQSSPLQKISAMGANALRVQRILANTKAATSTIPGALNFVDIGIHGVNFVSTTMTFFNGQVNKPESLEPRPLEQDSVSLHKKAL